MTDLNIAEREALIDHLAEKPAGSGVLTPLERYIRDGGTLAGYVAGWKRDRDEKARAGEPTVEDLDRALAAAVDGYGTVRDYLTELLTSFWCGRADPKYGMTGDSSWQYDIYRALNQVGLIAGWRDGYGLDKAEESKADELISAVIKRMAGVRSE